MPFLKPNNSKAENEKKNNAEKNVVKVSKPNPGQSLLDALIEDYMNAGMDDQSMLDICFSRNQAQLTALPPRYALIALGFIKRQTVQDVNENLRQNGFAVLYPRNLYELSIIYALNNGMSYEQWRSIASSLSDYKEIISGKKDELISNESITTANLREFVEANSTLEDGVLKTQSFTTILARSMDTLDTTGYTLDDLIKENISRFSTVREKTRYYVCKYLLYFLDTRKHRYLRALKTGVDIPYALSELASVIKSKTIATRTTLSVEESDKVIEEAAISMNSVFQAYQEYYFGFGQMDWMEILLESSNDLDSMDDTEKRNFVIKIREYYDKQKPNPVNHLSDTDAFEWFKAELKRNELKKDKEDQDKAASKKQDQKGRSGETFFRNVLKGNVDLDRSTLIGMLVFLGNSSLVPEEHIITLDRMNDILRKCGYAELTPSDPQDTSSHFPFKAESTPNTPATIDDFFIQFIQSYDKESELFTAAEALAQNGKDFYLYKSYLNSKSAEERWNKITERK